MELRKIKGVGERMAHRIEREFGGEDEFLEAARNFEVDRLARIEGISQRRAVEIINEVLGNPNEKFLKTERAIQLYEDIIKRILEHANTDYAQNRVLLLSPTKDLTRIRERMNKTMEAKKIVGKLPHDQIQKLLKKINPLENPQPRLDPGQALLVESKKDYENLLERNLHRYIPIITLDELEGLHEYELVIYAYNKGFFEVDDAPNLAMVPLDAEDTELVPSMTLSYYQHNREIIENAAKLRDILG
ncbi:MAG: helix-hairpin-helix domain-containing protein, partial [Methanobacteriaceae archaeon]|nr:helix-hairpin-helix domain-containing protein [Methanobacteriaceae archaeon]